MADIYYDSNATGANDGTSKADAFTTLAAALAAASSNGDTIWTSHLSAETFSVNQTLSFGFGTRLISVDYSGSTPPVSADWAAGASFAYSSGIVDINFVGTGYIYGIDFTAGDDMIYGNVRIIYEECSFTVGGSNRFNLSSGKHNLINCRLIFGATGVFIYVGAADFVMIGGSIEGDIILLMVAAPFVVGAPKFYGVNFTGTIGSIVAPGASNLKHDMLFSGCNLDPTNIWRPGYPFQDDAIRLLMYGTNGSNNPYTVYEGGYFGTIISETTLVKSGGASDGTTPISLKFVTSSYVIGSGLGLDMVLPIMFWANTTGNNTFTVDLLTDGLTLDESEVMLELLHPQVGTALKAFASSRLFDGSNLPASAATWDTTGMSNPSKQKVSITVNVGQAGWVMCRLTVARPSATVYADVKLLDSNRQYVTGQAYINSEALACDYPSEDDVRDGVDFNDGNSTGNMTLPIEANVKDGISYGTNGLEFTGTLDLTIKGPVKLLRLDTGTKVIKI